MKIKPPSQRNGRIFNLLLLSLFVVPSTFLKLGHAKTCIFVASYHKGHESTDLMVNVFTEKVKGKCDVKTFYMDSKNNQDRTFISNKGLDAKKLIESTNADLVVVADDNAVSDLLKPHFRDSKIPFVFIGINWSIEKYELPYTNTTGMIEVDPLQPLIQEMRKIIPNVKTVTRIAPKNETTMITSKHVKKFFSDSGIEFVSVMVENYDEWKKAFLEAQSTSDAIYLGGYQGVKGFKKDEVTKFILENSKKVPFGTSAVMAKHVTFSLARRVAEHAEFAADAGIKIMAGEKPRSIPVTTNKDYHAYLNEKFQTKFPLKFSEHFMKRISKIDQYKTSE